MSFVDVYDHSEQIDLENPAITFPYKLENFQKYSCRSIENGNNLLICAATGSGKTLPAIYAIAYHLRKGNRIIYTTPIKTLSNQKYKELIDIFNEFSKELNMPIKIGLLTGDNKINVDGQVIICTTEILRNALYCMNKIEVDTNSNTRVDTNCDLLDNLGCVILDEIHYICDASRGTIWEETLILLKSNIQIIMLSATLDKVEQFANWIGNIKKKI